MLSQLYPYTKMLKTCTDGLICLKKDGTMGLNRVLKSKKEGEHRLIALVFVCFTAESHMRTCLFQWLITMTLNCSSIQGIQVGTCIMCTDMK